MCLWVCLTVAARLESYNWIHHLLHDFVKLSRIDACLQVHLSIGPLWFERLILALQATLERSTTNIFVRSLVLSSVSIAQISLYFWFRTLFESSHANSLLFIAHFDHSNLPISSFLFFLFLSSPFLSPIFLGSARFSFCLHQLSEPFCFDQVCF